MARAARVPWLTGALCLLALGVHVAGLVRGPCNASPLAAQLCLLDAGAKSADLVTDAGESWRLLSSHLVHTSWLHLAFNLAFLFPVGAALEQTVPRRDYAGLLLASAVGANAASLIWTPGISAGASGLVFAVLGAALAFGLRHGRHMSPAVRPYFGLWVLPFLLVVLLLGARNPQIDHASHLGGLVMGVALGALLEPAGSPWPARVPATARLGAAALVVAVGVASAGHLRHGAGPHHRAMELPGGGRLLTPATWSARIGPLGSRGRTSAGGLVRLEVERLPDTRRPAEAYLEHLVDPLARAGLVSHVTRSRPRRLADGRGLHFFLDLSREAVPMRRHVYLLPAPDGGHLALALETPRSWSEKYAETRAGLLGSIIWTPDSARPRRLPTRAAGAIP